MISGYLLAVTVGSIIAFGIWSVPAFLDRSREKREMVLDASDRFFEAITKLARDDQTPDRILQTLSVVARRMPDPKMIRFILWRGLTGKVREHATHPTESIRQFRRDLRELPADVQTELGNALAYGILANALSAGVSGELFLRLMFPDPKAQKETATTLAAEMASCGEPQCLAAA